MQALLCLGSNIEPEKNLRFAIEQLFDHFNHVRLSDVYESIAVGFDGANFLNLVAQIETELPLSLLSQTVDRIEQAAGRVRVERGRYDSRTLDVDIIMYDGVLDDEINSVLQGDDIGNHAYVLLPLADLIDGQTDDKLCILLKNLRNDVGIHQHAWKTELVSLPTADS